MGHAGALPIFKADAILLLTGYQWYK